MTSKKAIEEIIFFFQITSLRSKNDESVSPFFSLLLIRPSSGLKSSSLKWISQIRECGEGRKSRPRPQAEIHLRHWSRLIGKLNWPTFVLENLGNIFLFLSNLLKVTTFVLGNWENMTAIALSNKLVLNNFEGIDALHAKDFFVILSQSLLIQFHKTQMKPPPWNFSTTSRSHLGKETRTKMN